MIISPKLYPFCLILVLLLPACFKSKQPSSVPEALKQLEDSGQIPKLNHDDTLLGPDADKNGVRDDIDAYINTLPDTELQKAALRQDSRTLNKALQVAVNGSDGEVLSAMRAIAKATSCENDLYDDSTASSRMRLIEKITINTKLRFGAYMKFDQRLRGKSYMLPQGSVCEN